MDRFDPNKVELFLDEYNTKEQSYLKRVIDNAVHIPNEELFNLLESALNDFHSHVNKYNLFLDPRKIGTEHWIFMELMKQQSRFNLHPENVIHSQECPNDLPILIIDDAIYSSAHMCSIIDSLQYYHGITVDFYCVAGVISSYNCQVATEMGANIFAGKSYEHLTMAQLFPDLDYKLLDVLFPGHFNTCIPVFFNHKIANEFGCYQFFHKIISKPISRRKIDQITLDDILRLSR